MGIAIVRCPGRGHSNSHRQKSGKTENVLLNGRLSNNFFGMKTRFGSWGMFSATTNQIIELLMAFVSCFQKEQD